VRGLPPLAKVCVEGSIANAVGVELEENPYDTANAPDAHYTWRWAWKYADVLLTHVAQHEVQAWLEDQDAA
jgi:hypothetical protein